MSCCLHGNFWRGLSNSCAQPLGTSAAESAQQSRPAAINQDGPEYVRVDKERAAAGFKAGKGKEINTDWLQGKEAGSPSAVLCHVEDTSPQIDT
eukprot:1156806-Pelagomonas_calceolata.AAC.8